ncbi:hypothetical protein [Kutzneria sp. NPDC051319]|uniref:hypothetical protein n=1 Tax=Kutzneria sp. NPDC051319 TaxID=3155047 RepID=UPI0034413D26
MANAHQVIGQLVLAISERRLLLGARDVRYGISAEGAIELRWYEGPYPREVASALAELSASGEIDLAAVEPTAATINIRASVVVEGLPVVMTATSPVGAAQVALQPDDNVPTRRRVGRLPEPLIEEGVAVDHVLWTNHETDGEVAVVVRLPLGVTHENPQWTESALHVAVPADRTPKLPWVSREMEIKQCRSWCDILLLDARYEGGFVEADAHSWLREQFDDRRYFRSTAAVALSDRCILRTQAGVLATITGTAAYGVSNVPWTMVPSVVQSATVRNVSPQDKRPCHPPATVMMRCFGDAYRRARLNIDVRMVQPSDDYVRSHNVAPQG